MSEDELERARQGMRNRRASILRLTSEALDIAERAYEYLARDLAESEAKLAAASSNKVDAVIPVAPPIPRPLCHRCAEDHQPALACPAALDPRPE